MPLLVSLPELKLFIVSTPRPIGFPFTRRYTHTDSAFVAAHQVFQMLKRACPLLALKQRMSFCVSLNFMLFLFVSN